MRFFVTCAKGTEGALRRELVALRIHAPRGDTGGVTFEGPFTDGMKVCLWSRVAMRVLLEVAAFPAPDADALYAGVRSVTWESHLSPQSTFAVTASVSDNEMLRHSGFVALKVKDAVADALRDRFGVRPDVSPSDPDVALFLHLRAAEARLFLDLAGEPLHRRGYRQSMTEAPLKETLAAAVLALGGVPLDEPFVDPMAGSGTFAIEQALAARRMAPGLGRRFGFERWPDKAHRPAWDDLQKEARDLALPRAPAPIQARDLDPTALASARRNAAAAGVADDITFEHGDISTFAPGGGARGTLCFNPPYGERLGAVVPGRNDARANRERPRQPARTEPRPADRSRPRSGAGGDVSALYARIGRTIALLPGWRIVILSGNPALAHAIGARPQVTHRLWNGPLEARLLVYR